MPELQISLAEKSELDEIATIYLAAFGTLPSIKILRPTHLRNPEFSAEQRAALQATIFKELYFSPPAAAMWVMEKAEVDGVIVAYSIWKRPEIFQDTIKQRVGLVGTVNSEVDQKAEERLVANYKVNRREAMGDQPHWYLKNLAVSPGHQGRGIGKSMLRHGLKRVDETAPSFPVYLETSAVAVPLYRSEGFKEVGSWILDSLKGLVDSAPVMVRQIVGRG